MALSTPRHRAKAAPPKPLTPLPTAGNEGELAGELRAFEAPKGPALIKNMNRIAPAGAIDVDMHY